MTKSKKCSKCKEIKTEDDFYARAASKDGLSATCKSCADENTKNWADKNADKRFQIRRDSHLKRKFGISLEQYQELLNKQNGCCAICERHVSVFSKELAVDHNHYTRRIRGLLCTNCNYRLVARHTNGSLLRKIADYIEQGTDWFVPEKENKKRKKNGRA